MKYEKEYTEWVDHLVHVVSSPGSYEEFLEDKLKDARDEARIVREQLSQTMRAVNSVVELHFATPPPQGVDFDTQYALLGDGSLSATARLASAVDLLDDRLKVLEAYDEIVATILVRRAIPDTLRNTLYALRPNLGDQNNDN